jgi:hypothetical protein
VNLGRREAHRVWLAERLAAAVDRDRQIERHLVRRRLLGFELLEGRSGPGCGDQQSLDDLVDGRELD